jgi:hypothetical protein
MHLHHQRGAVSYPGFLADCESSPFGALSAYCLIPISYYSRLVTFYLVKFSRCEEDSTHDQNEPRPDKWGVLLCRHRVGRDGYWLRVRFYQPDLAVFVKADEFDIVRRIHLASPDDL